jgi:hypothetical protein
MPEPTQLDAFLAGNAPEAEPVAAAEPEAKPEGEAAPVVETKPDAAKPDAAKPETDDEPPAARDGEAIVPRRAFEAVRHERQDWKAKAVAAETQRDELQRQLAEAKAAPAPQPTPQPAPREIPNPAVDPAGYHQWAEQERSKAEINQRLNFSEMLVTKELGTEKVAALIADFKEAAQANPQLTAQLYSQPHPYEWAAKQVEIIRAQKEIGTDPAAYRARIIAEYTAANGNGAAPAVPVSPASGMAPSLASARSVAGRSAPAFTGPLSMDDILAGAQGHKRA